MAVPSEALSPPSRKIGNLMMIWRIAVGYPAHIAAAIAALIVAASATLGVPYSF